MNASYFSRLKNSRRNERIVLLKTSTW